MNKATCDELLGEAEMCAVSALPSSASWADVSDELMRITSGSRFGMKALGFARLLVQSATMGLVLSRELESLGKERMTLMGVQDTRRRLQQKSDEVDHGNLLRTQKRQIEVEHRGLVLPILVDDPTEEVRMRIAAVVKGHAVGDGCLQELFGERFFCTTPFPQQTVAPELYTDAGAARAAITSILENSNVESGEYMKELVAKKQHVVISLDPSFKLELAYCAFVSGEGGEKVVQAKILGIMPSNEREETIIGALAKLVVLRESDMIKCCTRSAQSQLKLVVELVENMQKGVEPRIHTLALSEFMKKIGEATQWFMSLTIYEKGKSKVLRGASAMRLKIKNVRGLTVPERTLAMLQDFHLFRSLLNEDELAEVDDLTKGTLLTMVAVAEKTYKPVKGKSASSGVGDVIYVFS